MEENGTNGQNGEARPRFVPFTRLASNVKGRVDDQLGPITGFVGRNRSGKTSRLDAIRLALTSKHPSGPHGTDLMELAPDGSPYLECLLEGPSGRATFRVETQAGKPKKPDPAKREGLLAVLTEAELENVLPAQSMNTLISLGSTLGRETIFKRFGAISTVPTPRALSNEQLGMWQQGLKETQEENPSADSAERLSLVAAWMRRKKLAIGRDVKSLEKLVEEREQALRAASVGTEELPQLRIARDAARAFENAAALRTRKAQIEQEAAAYRAKATPMVEEDRRRKEAEPAIAEEMTRRQNELTALEAEVAGFAGKLKEQYSLLHFGEGCLRNIAVSETKMGEDGMAPCLFCGSPAHLPTLKGSILPRVQMRGATVEAMEKERDQKQAELVEKRAAFETWRREQESSRSLFEMQRAQLQGEYKRIKAAQEENQRALVGVPENYEGPSFADLETRIKLLESAEAANRQLDQDTSRLRQLKIDQDVAKVLEKEAERELNHLLQRTSETANAAVNKYMPEGFRAELDLETAKWRVVGKDGRPHHREVMAGSERGALTLSLACAWTEETPLRVLMLEDADLAPFDPDTLRLFFDAIKDAVDDGLLTQVFVAWSRAHELPEYVTKIFTDGATPPLISPARVGPVPEEAVL